MEEAQIFEEVIQRRLLGTISQDEFIDVLNRPAVDGGVGFDRRTAEKVVRRVNRVIRMAYFIYQEGHQEVTVEGDHDKISVDEKTKRVTRYILKTCYNEYYRHLDEVQINRLRSAVKERLEGEIQKPKFYELLDKPFKDGGVGLNSKTAKAFTEEMELVLILGFGIVQKRDPGVEKESKNDDKKKADKTNSDDHEKVSERLAKRIMDEVEKNAPEEKDGSLTSSEQQAENIDFENSVLNPDFASGKHKSLQDTMIEIQEREEKMKNN